MKIALKKTDGKHILESFRYFFWSRYTTVDLCKMSILTFHKQERITGNPSVNSSQEGY